jgi:hypothetical protein
LLNECEIKCRGLVEQFNKAFDKMWEEALAKSLTESTALEFHQSGIQVAYSVT